MLRRQNNAVQKLLSRCRTISQTTHVISVPDLPAPAYKPELVEKNKYDKWEKSGLFKAEASPSKQTFSMILPPPNVTGKLHLGHALACTVQDVIARRKRSMGYNVLWLPGIDHAGIATQGVVEKYLKSTQNITRHDIGRVKFTNEVWKWKVKHGNTISQQLRTLGCSLDWSREVFTMDPGHMYAVNTAFIELWTKGLIYRKKALVNWCNSLKSTVSDIEVENVAIKGPTDMMLPGYSKPVRLGLLYNFAYKLCDSNEELVVSTTMPETMLGDTAVAVHPEDARYRHLRGRRVTHPFKNKTIPIIFDSFVDMSFGTGAVKITPAHSKVDYEVSKRHLLPLEQVIDEEGKMINSEEFDDMLKYDCRVSLVKELENMGLLKAVTPHQMVIPTCSRTGDIIEYLPKEQWFLYCSKLNERAADLVKTGQLKIKPEKFVKNWLDWCRDDRDWCISRQLWWGHQVPAYKCTYGNETTWIAATDANNAKNAAAKHFKASPSAIQAEKDTDVLDTWFSSGIYPFASLGWLTWHFNDDFKTFYPLSLMATGHDILGFWVHRMVILGLELTKKLPFKNVLLHGVVCDNRGAKMSKSKGNVIDPIDVIDGISLNKLKLKTQEMHKDGILNKDEVKKALDFHKSNFTNSQGIPECGVDALRFTLLSQDLQSHFVNFDVSACYSNKLFCNKIWQSVKYTNYSFNKLKPADDSISKDDLTNFDRWILSRLAHMIDTVNNHIEKYEFHLATKALRTFIYNEICDIYIEATKAGFNDNDWKVGYAHAHTLSTVLNASLRCLAPFMVYLTDELIPKIPQFEKSIVYNFKDTNSKFYTYPQFEDFEEWKDKEVEKDVDRVIKAIFLIRQLKGFYSMSNKMRPSVYIDSRDKMFVSSLKQYEAIVTNLSKTVSVHYGDKKSDNFVSGILDKDTKVHVEILATNIETAVSEAREKVLKKIKQLEANLVKMEEKHSTARYIASASKWDRVLDRDSFLSKKAELEQLQRLIE